MASNIVMRRLKFSAVSPKLMNVYSAGEMTMALAGAARKGYRCRVAVASQNNAAHGHVAWFDVAVRVRRSLHHRDGGCAGLIAFEPAEFFCGDNDDFVATVHNHMLRTLATDTPHELTKTSLGILKQSPARRPRRLARRRF